MRQLLCRESCGQGRGRESPTEYFGYADGRVNGQESGGLPLPALGGAGKTKLCFRGRMMGTEEGEEEVTSGGGQMLQGLMGHLGSHEKVFVCLIFLSWFVFVFDIYVPFIF